VMVRVRVRVRVSRVKVMVSRFRVSFKTVAIAAPRYCAQTTYK